MNTGNIIIITLCILAFILPFVLIGRKGRKKKKGLKMSLQNLANKHNFQIDQLDIVDDLALGVDENNHVAFFAEAVNDGFKTNHVVLGDSLTCILNRKTRNVNTNFGNESLLSQLKLVFSPKSKNEEINSFILFDESNGKRLGDELQFGNKWAEIYNRNRK